MQTLAFRIGRSAEAKAPSPRSADCDRRRPVCSPPRRRSADMSHHHGAESDPKCADASLACATQVTPTFAPDGTLWLVWAANRVVSVAHSSDLGRTFSTPVAVNSEPLDLDWGPDSRPNIVVDKDGRVFVAFARFKDQKFNGEVFYSRSTDGGRSFARPAPITANAESQRFQALALDADGSLLAAWLDKRNRVPAAARGDKYVGAGLAFAWSRDHGASFSETRIALDNTCECCRLAVGFAAAGRPVRGVPQHFRRHGARPRGDHVRRCAYSRAGPARQRRRLEDRGLSAPGADARHRRRRQLSRCLVHQRHGAQGLVLCAVERRRPDLLAADADRRPGAQSRPSILARRRADTVARLEGIRRRAHQCADDDIA